MRLTMLLVLAAALLGCAALAGSNDGAAVAQPASGTAALPELLQRLRALEAASTCTASAGCHAVPVGARLCGGPSAWLAMSSAQMAAAAPLAERYTALRKSANEASEKEGMAGSCQAIPQPAVGCVAGYCRTLPGGPSGRVD